MSQLSTLFVLAGLWFYCARRVRWLTAVPTATDFSSVLLGLAVFTVLAALCKENGALLPLYVAALELALFRGRVSGGRALFPYRLSQLALLLPALVLLVLVISRPEWLLSWYAHRDFGPGERLLTQLRVLWLYLSWLVPWDVTVYGLFHDDVTLSTSLLQPWTTLPALAAWIAAGALAWRFRDRLPLLGFAVLWYLAGHVMESTLVPLELVFEHRNYLPSMGPLLLLAWLITAVPKRRYTFALSGTALALMVLGSLLYLRTSYWTSELAQAEAQYRHHPESRRSRLHLANVYVEQMPGQRDQQVVRKYFMGARELHWRNVQLDRTYVPSLYALVYLESLARRPEEVQRLYQQLAAILGNRETRVTEMSSLRQLVTCIDGGACLPPSGGARNFLERLLRQRESLFTRELLLQHCAARKDYDCVKQQAESALALDAGFVQGYLALFNASFARGDSSGAHIAAQRMLMADRLRMQVYGVRDGVRMLE